MTLSRTLSPEEIVGEIEDEFDAPDGITGSMRIDRYASGARVVRLRIFSIDDFNSQFGVELPGEDYHTVAGFVFGELGRGADARRRGRSTPRVGAGSSTSTRSRASASTG